VEGEIAYRDNDMSLELWLDAYITGPTYSGFYYTYVDLPVGEAKVLSIMANAWYEFENDSRWTPFVGAGVGWADVELTSEFGSTSDSGMAFQLGVGIDFELSGITDLVLEYRYFSMIDDEYTVFGLPTAYDYQSQSIIVGMKVTF